MANTTADKLAKLNTTKADLKAALAEKGQTVGDVFSTYPAAVRAIETGGELVTGTITEGRYGGITQYSDGEGFKLLVGSGTIRVLKNTAVVTFSDSSFETSGGISEIKNAPKTIVNLVTGDFTISFR